MLFDLHIDGKKQTKRISTKILKIDKSNQYGQAMTKPLPHECINKQKHPPSLLKFNKILHRISHEDKIGHLGHFTIRLHKLCCSKKFINQSLKKTKRWSRLKDQTFNL